MQFWPSEVGLRQVVKNALPSMPAVVRAAEPQSVLNCRPKDAGHPCSLAAADQGMGASLRVQVDRSPELVLVTNANALPLLWQIFCS
jgi:hypothetical protein